MSLAQKKGCNLHVQVVRGEEVVISLGRQSYRLWILNLEAMTLEVTSASCQDCSSVLTHLCDITPSGGGAGSLGVPHHLTLIIPAGHLDSPPWCTDCHAMVLGLWTRLPQYPGASLHTCERPAAGSRSAEPVGREMVKLCLILLLHMCASRTGMRVSMCST